MDTTATFRASIKRERERRGMNHRQFADLIGVKHPWTYNLEVGASATKQGVTLTTVDRFAEALGATAAELLTEEDAADESGPISTPEAMAAGRTAYLQATSAPAPAA